MGDPFSVTAGTAGFLSLGIEVCKGLIKIYGAWKSHDQDIKDTLERLEDLSFTLTTLVKISSTIEDLDDSTSGPLGQALQSIRSCAVALNKLHRALINSEPISPPAGILDKVHNVRVRSMHLFNNDTLKNLRSAAAEAQKNLSSAIQVLHLHLVVEQGQAFKELVVSNRNQVDEISNAFGNALMKRLEQNDQSLSALQKEMRITSSQHVEAVQQVAQSISALQLGVAQKPNLLQSTIQGKRELQCYAPNRSPRFIERCTCPALKSHKLLGSSKLESLTDKPAPRRCSVAIARSSVRHHSGCPLYWDTEYTRQLAIRVAYSGTLLAGAVQASISISRCSGGFEISPTLAFIPTVPCNAPVFKVYEVYRPEILSASALQEAFTFRKQELLRLYSEGKASPRDVDEEGNNVLHMACNFFRTCEPRIESVTSFYFCMDSNSFHLYFQYLRDLQQMGVPLNSTNAKGLTPLAVLMNHYAGLFPAKTYTRNLTCLGLKMYDIGAELSMFNLNAVHAVHTVQDDASSFGENLARFPELARSFGCTEIAQAVLDKSRSSLDSAINQNILLVNKPNALGQTPLHLSVDWPEGVRVLLAAGAAIDSADKDGYTPIFYAAKGGLLDAILILSDAGCAFHAAITGKPQYYSYPLLEYTVRLEHRLCEIEEEGTCIGGFFGAPRKATEVFDLVLELVVQRRRTLEKLARASLSQVSVHQLCLSLEKILDHKASVAESMLRERLQIPESLVNLSRPESTVYHCPFLNLRQAAAFWKAGFRDIDELDDQGLSPLVNLNNIYRSWNLNKAIEFQHWLVMHGADPRRQDYTLQPAGLIHGICQGRRASLRHLVSSTTALHYLAAQWGPHFCRHVYSEKPVEEVLDNLSTLTDKSKSFMQTILTDVVRDRCNCACSAQGCRTYTMMEKCVLTSTNAEWFGKTCRRAALLITLAFASFLEVDQPGLEWLRRDMLRAITFDALRLRHTCCKLSGDQDLIVEVADEEEGDEIREEQMEKVKRLKGLLLEFESKLEEIAIPFVQFIEGYWWKRMREVRRESRPIDVNKLRSIGVQLQETGCHSSSSSDDEVEVEEVVDDEEEDDEEEDIVRESI